MAKSLKEIIAEEYLRCAQSPVHFMKRHCLIQHPDRGKVHFNLYPFQEQVLYDFSEHRYTIVNKGRQLGISTLAAGYALYKMSFVPDFNILVIATKQDVAKNLVTKVRVMHENLPSWLKVQAIEDNKLSLRLKNGSQIKAVAASPDAGRSEALSLLIIDEAAHIDLLDDIWTAAQSTLSTGGSAILFSCVTKDTMVFTSEGIKEVSEFIDSSKVGNYEVPRYHLLGKDKLREGFLFNNNGKVPTRKIITKFSELEGSENHKLWAYKNKQYGWYTLSELNKGDYISIQYGSNIWGNDNSLADFKPKISHKYKYKFSLKDITEDIAYLFGLYISEGHAYKVYNKEGILAGGSITITCGDNISQVFDNIGIPYYHNNEYVYTISSKYFIELFEYVGFDLSKKAPEKEIPLRLLKMSEKNIIQLIRGIIDGDGSADRSRNRVNLVSSSERLINQVRVILLNFGILSSKYSRTVEKLNENLQFKYEFKHPSFILEISGYDAYLYAKKISFNIKRKKEVADEFHLPSSRNVKDIIPNSLKMFKDIKKYSGLKNFEISEILGYKVNSYLNETSNYKTSDIMRRNVLGAYEAFSDILEGTDWSKVVSPDLMWLEIKDIIEGENETYDFSLPDLGEENEWSHSVIYNGMLGHQSPNGVGNLFHKIWVDAGQGKQFFPIRLPWYVHPERDQSWRDAQDELLGTRMAAQENDCSFVSSGHTVIEGPIIEWYKETYEQEPLERRGFDGGYWIWSYPSYTKSYIVAADVARGDGEDESAFVVLDAETAEQVAEYRGTVSTKDFGNMLVAVASEWNNALLIIDNNGVGWSVVQVAIDRNYKNLFYYYNNDAYVDSDKHLVRGYDIQDKSKMTPGISINTKTRPVMISKLETYFREKTPICKSKRSTDEFSTFVWKNGKAQARKGYRDDLTMCWAMGFWVRDTALKLKQQGVDLQKSTLDNFTRVVYTPNSYNKGKLIHKMPNGKDEDLSWLL